MLFRSNGLKKGAMAHNDREEEVAGCLLGR